VADIKENHRRNVHQGTSGQRLDICQSYRIEGKLFTTLTPGMGLAPGIGFAPGMGLFSAVTPILPAAKTGTGNPADFQ
jgi:hypothetical protein